MQQHDSGNWDEAGQVEKEPTEITTTIPAATATGQIKINESQLNYFGH